MATLKKNNWKNWNWKIKQNPHPSKRLIINSLNK